MKILRATTAPRYQRPDGITSYLLASSRTCGTKSLTTTLVVIQPGGSQRLHQHLPEQTYFVLEGAGEMTVGDETADVRAGDCVFVPADAPHGIRNSGSGVMRYFSAAAPAFSRLDETTLWPLPSEEDERRKA